MVTQWGLSAPQQPLPTFRPMSIVANRSPISATAELLSIFLLIFEWGLQQCSATALPMMSHSAKFLCLCSSLVSCLLDENVKRTPDLGSCFSRGFCLRRHRTLQLNWQPNVFAAMHANSTKHNGHGVSFIGNAI